ncbi:unnamed protein product [Symbiodinium microadriaticum]|nr:unnamed protein product [Symbiodinium microadriaticum]
MNCDENDELFELLSEGTQPLLLAHLSILGTQLPPFPSEIALEEAASQQGKSFTGRQTETAISSILSAWSLPVPDGAVPDFVQMLCYSREILWIHMPYRCLTASAEQSQIGNWPADALSPTFAHLTALKSALERGPLALAVQSLCNVRKVTSRFFAGSEEELENVPTCTGQSESTSPREGGLNLDDEAAPTAEPEWISRKSEQMTKYMFLDEGSEKGTVKIYVKAEELQIDQFADAYASFQERRLSLYLLGPGGRVWRLSGRLFGPVQAKDCKCSLSASGHKVSVTLRKSSTSDQWHRLIEDPGKEQLDKSQDFI